MVHSAASLLVAGPLADSLFEPLMAANGLLAGSLGRLIGMGPGRGIGLLLIVLGVFTVGGALVGYLYPRLRRVENDLPDVISDMVPVTSCVPAAIENVGADVT